MEKRKSGSVNGTDKFVKTGPLQLALREMHHVSGNARFWIGMAAVVAILAIGGPFGTQSAFSLPERSFYWAAISLGTFFTGLLTTLLTAQLCEAQGMSPKLAPFAGAAAAGMPITAMVRGINVFVVGMEPSFFSDLATLWAYCTAITVAVVLLYGLLRIPALPSRVAGGEVETIQIPRIAARLTKPIGHDIIALKAQDHYVEIFTTLGSELVLVRLADAESELNPNSGFRVHRSWWVAERHVLRIARKQGRITLNLSNGMEVPVSRSFRHAAERLALLST
ncbi:MAG: LytTR family DNA-binding domain-containing protein [Nitratireductor sp.]